MQEYNDHDAWVQDCYTSEMKFAAFMQQRGNMVAAVWHRSHALTLLRRNSVVYKQHILEFGVSIMTQPVSK